MKRILVQNNQSIWDIAIQEYGSMEGAKQLIIDNPTKCDFQNSLKAGMELLITLSPINKTIQDYFTKNRIKPATAVEVLFNPLWILNDGEWNDNGFWDNNSLWID